MPTYGWLPRFWREHKKLTDAQAKQFRKAVDLFVHGLREHRFHPSLRIHRVGSEGTVAIWSMSWGEDQRATFSYGEELQPGNPHVIWRRIGSHSIYDRP